MSARHRLLRWVYKCCLRSSARAVTLWLNAHRTETVPRSKDTDAMKGLRKVAVTYALIVLLLATFVSHSWSAPKNFQRRNWTPQAMLYLKGTQGRRFVSEDRKEGNIYDTLHLETRSQNTEKLSMGEATSILLNLLQQAQEGADNLPGEVYLQELPLWKRQYF